MGGLAEFEFVLDMFDVKTNFVMVWFIHIFGPYFLNHLQLENNTHTPMITHTHARMHVHTHTHTHTHAHTRMHPHTHTHARTHAHTRMHLQPHLHTRACTHFSTWLHNIISTLNCMNFQTFHAVILDHDFVLYNLAFFLFSTIIFSHTHTYMYSRDIFCISFSEGPLIIIIFSLFQ
jgi:hypothetical protein